MTVIEMACNAWLMCARIEGCLLSLCSTSLAVQALGQMLQAGLGTNPLLRGSSGAPLARGSSGGAPTTPPATPPGLAKQDVALLEGKAAPAGHIRLR